MDMSVVFLMTIGLLGCSVVAGLFETAPVVVRRRYIRGSDPVRGLYNVTW